MRRILRREQTGRRFRDAYRSTPSAVLPGHTQGGPELTNPTGTVDTQQRRGGRLRVLFVFEGLYGRGAERVALGLIAQLDRSRFEPSIWILRSEDALLPEVPPDVPMTVVLARHQRIRHALLRVLTTLLCAARQADVIVGTVELMPTYFAGLAGALTHRPVIGWVRNSMDQTYAEQPRWHRWLSGWLYRRLPRLVFVSQGSRQTLRQLQPLHESTLSVVYNPVDVAGIEVKQLEALPAWAGFMTQEPTVVAAGRLVRQKGFDLLIRAHAALRGRGVAHQLVIVGEGELRASLEALIAELGVQDSVHLPGYLPNPYPVMRQATVFALSSRWEGLAGVVIEAMACGAAVVAFDCPSGPSEILEGGRYGLLVPPEDAEALSEALGRVLSDAELRRELSEHSRRRAQDFAPRVTVPQWEALLLQTAGQS
jgi:glycosyltransferase involved in cell wall biosynthesis